MKNFLKYKIKENTSVAKNLYRREGCVKEGDVSASRI